MGEALGAADEVVVLDVYLAREDADPAVTGALVADAVPLPAGAGGASSPTSPTSPRRCVARARPGDLVLTLGAGTVTEVGPAGARAAGGAREARLPERRRRPGDAGRPSTRSRRSGSPAGSGPAAGWPGATSSRSLLAGRARGRRRVWLVFFSPLARGRGRRGRAAPGRCRADEVRARGRRTRRASRWPGSTSAAIRGRVEALAAVESADVTRQWPDRC